MTTTDVSSYFNANWKKYQRTIASNTLYHREIGDMLNGFLDTHLQTDFSFIDIGCGDCSTIIPILLNKKIKKYIGVDAAADVLKIAEENCKVINCEKEFICDNMSNAIKKILTSQDVIFASYAVHHLTTEEKFAFLQHVQEKLKSGGFFIMIDGVLNENQTRDEWLHELAERMRTTQGLSPDELIDRMQHPRADDHPDSIETFSKFAKQQNWKKFEVLFHKDIFAMLVFAK